MPLRTLIILPLSFFSFAGSALQMDHSLQDCDRTKFQKNANDLIQSVNIIYQRDENGNLIQKDPRQTLKKGGQAVGLSADEIKMTSKNMAKILCYDKDGDWEYTTASLVNYKDTLITAAHVFYTKDGVPRRPCAYQMLTPPYEMVELPVTSDTVKVYTTKGTSDKSHDKAIIRLPHLINGAHPFKLDGNQNALKTGEHYINVSAQQEGMENRAKPTDIIVQKCTAQTIYSVSPKRPAVILSDCSGTKGSCGAINLSRIDGELRVTSLEIDSGKDSRNYQPFDTDMTHNAPSTAFSLAIDPEMIAQLKAMSLDPDAKIRTAVDDQADPSGRSN